MQFIKSQKATHTDSIRLNRLVDFVESFLNSDGSISEKAIPVSVQWTDQFVKRLDDHDYLFEITDLNPGSIRYNGKSIPVLSPELVCTKENQTVIATCRVHYLFRFSEEIAVYICKNNHLSFVLIWQLRDNAIFYCDKYCPIEEDSVLMYNEDYVKRINVVTTQKIAWGSTMDFPVALNPLGYDKPVFISQETNSDRLLKMSNATTIIQDAFDKKTRSLQNIFCFEVLDDKRNPHIVLYDAKKDVWYQYKDLSTLEVWSMYR